MRVVLGAAALSMLASWAVGYSVGDRFGTPRSPSRSNEEIVASIVSGALPEHVRPVSADMHGDWVRIVYAVRYRKEKCTMLVGNGTITACEGGSR